MTFHADCTGACLQHTTVTAGALDAMVRVGRIRWADWIAVIKMKMMNLMAVHFACTLECVLVGDAQQHTCWPVAVSE